MGPNAQYRDACSGAPSCGGDHSPPRCPPTPVPKLPRSLHHSAGVIPGGAHPTERSAPRWDPIPEAVEPRLTRRSAENKGTGYATKNRFKLYQNGTVYTRKSKDSEVSIAKSPAAHPTGLCNWAFFRPVSLLTSREATIRLMGGRRKISSERTWMYDPGLMYPFPGAFSALPQ